MEDTGLREELETIQKLLDGDQLTPAEKWVIKWQFGHLGDFQRALANVIARADDGNLERLAKGFPEQIQGYRAWTQGGLGTKLRAMGLEI